MQLFNSHLIFMQYINLNYNVKLIKTLLAVIAMKSF